MKRSWNGIFDWQKWQVKNRKQKVENTIIKLVPPWVSNKKIEDSPQSEEKGDENKKMNGEFIKEELDRAI